MQNKIIELFFKLPILFLNIAISIFLGIDLIINWIMIKVADRQIAFVAGIIAFVFFGAFLISAVLKITQQAIVYHQVGRYNNDGLKGFLIAFSILFTLLTISLIIRNLAWFNPTWMQLMVPQGFATALSIIWIGYFSLEAYHFYMN